METDCRECGAPTGYPAAGLCARHYAAAIHESQQLERYGSHKTHSCPRHSRAMCEYADVLKPVVHNETTPT